jgi:hypothetical protein
MQVFEIIKTLTNAEIRDVRIMLRSDWFNYREDVRQLFEILVIKVAKTPNIALDKAQLFAELYPDKKIDDRYLRLAGSWLTDAIEAFFQQKIRSEEALSPNIKLATTYRKRNLPKLSHQNLNLAKTQLEAQSLRNADYLQAFHGILAEEYRFDAATKRTEALNLQALGDSLDNWYFAQKMRQICIAQSHQTVYKTEYKFSFLQPVLLQIESENLMQIPAIGLYYYCYQALLFPENEALFALFRQKTVEHGDLFPEDELRDLFLLAINFCTRRVNEGSRVHIREGFELYRNGFEKKVFIVNGVLSRFTFRNAAALGLMLKELDWVDSFLPQFRDFIEPQYRKSTYDFSLARLENERGNFQAALLLLQNAEYEDVLATLSAKTLALKILYETNALNALDSHLDAMKIFIRRHKEIGYHRDNYTHLIRFVQRLIALQPSDKEAIAKLKEEIIGELKLAEKEWLLSKLLPFSKP